VKNNLATIVSLAEQTGRAAHSYEQFLEAFLGRVRALARMHGALAASKWEGATVEAIVSKTLSTFAAHRSSFQADGPPLMLAPQQAQALTLALHELATNAAKHGSLRDPRGRVDVRWSATSGNDPTGASTLRLEWAESGGRVIEKPTRRGFGSELIEGMIHHELGGTVRSDYKPQGLVCTIDVPMMEYAGQGLGAGADDH
jgi:two-component sensor histidine kinase